MVCWKAHTVFLLLALTAASAQRLTTDGAPCAEEYSYKGERWNDCVEISGQMWCIDEAGAWGVCEAAEVSRELNGDGRPSPAANTPEEPAEQNGLATATERAPSNGGAVVTIEVPEPDVPEGQESQDAEVEKATRAVPPADAEPDAAQRQQTVAAAEADEKAALPSPAAGEIAGVELGAAEIIASPGPILISEISATPGDEWLELYNLADESLDMTGWQLVFGQEPGQQPQRFTLGDAAAGCNVPQLTLMGASAFKKWSRHNQCSFTFDLQASSKDTVSELQILDDQGQVVDHVRWQGQIPDSSTLSRLYDAEQEATYLASGAPTPLEPNRAMVAPVACCAQLQAIGFSSNLPVMILDTGGREIPDEPKLKRVRLCQCLPGDQGQAYNGLVSIEIRGSTSARDYFKKSYAVKLVQDDGETDRKWSMLGMPRDEDWIFYGPEQDFTMGMRNFLAYTVSRAMGRYASRMEHFELFLQDDGEELSMDHYHGLYAALESIKRDKNRVDITRNEGSVMGGYIWKYENNNIDRNDTTFNLPRSGLTMILQYPRRVNNSQLRWLQQYVDGFEASLLQDDFADPITGYQSWADLNSLVDYFLAVEFTKNPDAYRGSTYMHKDVAGQMLMGPLWDYNEAFGICCGYPIEGYQRNGNSDGVSGGSAISTNGWRFNICSEPVRCQVDPLDGISVWYRRIWQDPLFRQAAARRWMQLRSSALTNEYVGSLISAKRKEIQAAATRNYRRWREVPMLSDKTWQEEMDKLRSWCMQRLNWMEEELKQLLDEQEQSGR